MSVDVKPREQESEFLQLILDLRHLQTKKAPKTKGASFIRRRRELQGEVTLLLEEVWHALKFRRGWAVHL